MASEPQDDFALVRTLRQQNYELLEENRSLKSGGGGGTSGGMEARVNRLEQRLDKFGDDLGEASVSLATVAERVSHLPTKDFMRETMRNWVLIGVGLSGALFTALTFGLKAIGKG